MNSITFYNRKRKKLILETLFTGIITTWKVTKTARVMHLVILVLQNLLHFYNEL